MLHDFVTIHREAIIDRTREMLAKDPAAASTGGLENGVPLFLTQLSDTLRAEGHSRRLRPAQSATPRLGTVASSSRSGSTFHKWFTATATSVRQ